MPTNLDAITTATLAQALDAATLRQQAIAANIANHGVAGYAPQKVDFAARMDDVRRALAAGDTALLGQAPLRMTPKVDSHGQPARVHLDAEMADMAQNAVHFQALTRALNRHFAILQSAASDGKR